MGLGETVPKAIFLNLPEEKRQRLIDLAVEEFATHDYRVASISRIVARAGIAKGSRYQYFDDKRDLLRDLLNVAVDRRRLDFMPAAQPEEERQGFFDLLRWMLRGSVQTACEHPQLAQFSLRAYTADLPCADEAMERGKAIAIAVMAEFNQVYLKRIGGAPDALIGTDLAVSETATAHRLYDDFCAIQERGLAVPPASG